MTNQWHQMAVDKGWHDNDEMGPDGTPSARQRIVWAGLMLTEWVEAIEDGGERIWRISNGKPVGVISEFVDVWIRGADTLGACAEPLDGKGLLDIFVSGAHICYCLGKAIEACRTGDWETYAQYIRGAMYHAKESAECQSVLMTTGPTWDEALRLKTAYNATRSHRHGGKLA